MIQNKLEAALELIGSAIFELFERDEKGIPVNQEDKESSECVNSLLKLTDTAYILVKWPESQELMEEEWFDEEAIFCGGSEEKTGSSAYFIPLKRLL
jgi:hypothetical protein